MAELRASAAIDRKPRCLNQLIIVKPPELPAGIYFRFADFFSILGLPLAGSLLRQTTENLDRNLCFWTLLSFITVTLIASHGGYRAQLPIMLRRQTGLAIRCFIATCIAMLLMAVLLGHAHILARRWTGADLLVTPLLISLSRTILTRRLASEYDSGASGGWIVICYDHCPSDLPKALDEQQISRRISGVLYLRPGQMPDARDPWPALPDIETLLKTIRTKNIQDIIFVHHPELDVFTGSLRRELLSDLLAFPARIWLAVDVASNLPDMLKGRSGSCKIVPIVMDDLVSSVNVAKRAFDLVTGSILLLLSVPLLLLSACLVKASGPGPIIFRQIRTGAHGRQFHVLKFRTMAHEPHRPFAQATQNDARITRIGRFLRRSSLDELLQLFNVIRGDMSLVGPRPHAPETQVEGINFENAVRLYRLRHRVKPGITGLAQIRGQRGETPAITMLEQRLASDLEYIRSWSLWLDISIILQTVPMIFTQTNAG
jgi:polysaccharide biosynthesis protein PslA